MKQTHTNSYRLITLAAVLLAAAFFLFFNTSKHDPAFSQVMAFGEDPFDAVGSFGVMLAGFAALLSLLRLVRPHGAGPVSLDEVRRVLRGAVVILLALLVTMAADGVALVRYQTQWSGYGMGWVLAAGVGGLAGLALLGCGLAWQSGKFSAVRPKSGARLRSLVEGLAALVILAFYPESWRQTALGALLTALAGTLILVELAARLAKAFFPHPLQPGEDLLDDLGAFYTWIKERAAFTGALFRGLEALAGLGGVRWAGGWLNPRRHPWNVALLAGLVMGGLLLIAEALGEGAPDRSHLLLVVGVVLGLASAGVLLGYAEFRRYLDLFHD